MESSPPESSDLKAAFHKPSNDAANRNYRRHSPTDGSSSSDADLEHDHSSSPKHTRKDPVKGRDYQERKKDDERNLPRDSSRHQGRSGDSSYRYSERRTSKSSYTQSRHDDHRRQESDHNRSRDYAQDRDKYSRSKYDGSSLRSKDGEKETPSLEHQKHRVKEIHKSDSGRRKSYFEESERDRNDRDKKREYRRSSVDHRSGWDKEESKGHHIEFTAGKERDGQKLVKERNLEDSDSVKSVDPFDRGFKNPFDDKSIFEGDRNIPTKKPRLFSSNGGPDSGKNDDGTLKSQEADKAKSAQANANASEVANDLNDAKFAAMRAAELVNRNLAGGTSYMSAEQKKKLLWGNKKSSSAEESSSQWNVSLISDPERQEKFNKLMSLRLRWYLWPIVGCEGRCEVFGTKAQERRWEQQPRPSGETGGAAGESRETVHCWAPKKGWQNRWFRSLGIRLASNLNSWLCRLLFWEL